MPLQFQVNHRSQGELVPQDENAWTAFDVKLKNGIEGLLEEKLTPARLVRICRDLIKKEPHYLKAYAVAAEVAANQEDEKTAEEMLTKGAQAGRKLISSKFQGRLEIANPNVEAFLRCQNGVIDLLLEAEKFTEALAETEKLLAWDRKDLFERRTDLGELYILAGRAEEAWPLLRRQMATRPTAAFSLGFLAFRKKAYPRAAAFLRHGFLSAPYLGEIFNGNLLMESRFFWDQGLEPNAYEEAMDYFHFLGGQVWSQDEEALTFATWLYNSSLALRERADLTALNEKIVLSRRKSTLEKCRQAYRKMLGSVTVAASRRLVAQVKDSRTGETVYPWQLTVNENGEEDDQALTTRAGETPASLDIEETIPAEPKKKKAPAKKPPKTARSKTAAKAAAKEAAAEKSPAQEKASAKPAARRGPKPTAPKTAARKTARPKAGKSDATERKAPPERGRATKKTPPAKSKRSR